MEEELFDDKLAKREWAIISILFAGLVAFLVFMFWLTNA